MSVKAPENRREIAALLQIMADLRHPDHGCEWDRLQTYESISHYTVEEAYEVADAIREQDMDGLRKELGDLLLQVVFHSAIAQDRGDFTFADVVESITDKLVRRHPHVFGTDEERAAGAQHGTWEAQKAEERAEAARRRGRERAGVLDDVPLALPALTRCVKLQNRAARVGFDWPDIHPVIDKIAEEARELADEARGGGTAERITEEYGDLLFVMTNLARHLKIDPESALEAANAKFERRFRGMEDLLEARGRSMDEGFSLEELDSLWDAVKDEEKAGRKAG